MYDGINQYIDDCLEALSVDYLLLQNQDFCYYSFWYSIVLLYPKYKFVYKQGYGYPKGKEYLWDGVVHLRS